ncbi:adenosylcobinamide-GDP ribazoletransferase [Aureibacter tunicatorum]|uniref:Adenosylcobinamide-GDP ribazoletransferase n=1 Tax=Aureibacter tunicatorum TaxID=866807 RepID=A0AAE3XNB3_9BACT|nr:adenosylcobinamide-GDP ribazoletransferase [Aureibacter tunicatorum]MDR6239632.1 adenosylcobinamide-GDP ribazoletransferase [Aureibacter tunicatorum]BDD04108.1 adenosylcobinamide-GDP ribazoletransferase [Aureibacter tunicatorum]
MMIKRELELFLLSLTFFTRLPISVNLEYTDEKLSKSTKYFSLIGILVGGVSALVYWSFSFLFPKEIAVLVSMVSTVLLTGAFHEDGLADVCDGFGGGWTKERILTIMKDSRIGTFGFVGLFLTMLLKFYSLLMIDETVILQAMVFSHAASRFVASTFLHTHEYARIDQEIGKAKPIAQHPLSVFDWMLLIVMVAIVAFFFPSILLAFSIVLAFVFKYFFGRFMQKWVGGYTGDCLGATQQISEVLIYMSILAIWKFI